MQNSISTKSVHSVNGSNALHENGNNTMINGTIRALAMNGQKYDWAARMGNYVRYVSGYSVVDRYGQLSKHYYAGSERIASRLAGPSTAFVDAEDLEGDHVDALPALQQMDIRIPVQGWGIGLGQGSFENVPLPGDECDNYTPGSEEYKQCICEQDGTCEDVIYWYHPDHLGSSTFLTDRAGQPYQFVMYLPFGETFAEQRAAGFGTPYLFNAKELDEETGLYYYGARYYDPRISTWWGVDPKAADAPNWTPYRYAFNNPIRIIDPDGQFETKFGAWLYNASQGFKGKVHKSQTRPGEYYVGRQIKSSNEARYDIKWSGNSERPGGGLINALDKTPQLAKTLKKHVSNVLPSPIRVERSGDFGVNRDEFNGGTQFSLSHGQGGGTGYSPNADVGPALDDLIGVAGIGKANGNTLSSAADQIQYGADILQTVGSLRSAYGQASGNQFAVDSICNGGCGGKPHYGVSYNTYNKSGQVIETNKYLPNDK